MGRVSVSQFESREFESRTPLQSSLFLITKITIQLLGDPGMATEVVKFEFEKEVKNSVRYKEVTESEKAPIVGTLYVQKWFTGSAKTLQITIELNV